MIWEHMEKRKKLEFNNRAIRNHVKLKKVKIDESFPEYNLLNKNKLNEFIV
tara:strand:- start:386 stop:538 length:153 start_codon:yes stop_codon:yes gene_type:complete